MFNYVGSAALIIAAAVVMDHFSFDEEIVSICERSHPNSFQGQLLCQKRVHKEKELRAKEAAAKACLDIDEKRIRSVVSSIRSDTIDNSGKDLLKFKELLEQKYKNESFWYNDNSSKKERNIVGTTIATKCNSSYGILINIRSQETLNKVDMFSASENSPPDDLNYKSKLPEFFWISK
jgi:hypothetical protein